MEMEMDMKVSVIKGPLTEENIIRAYDYILMVHKKKSQDAGMTEEEFLEELKIAKDKR